MTRVGVIGVGGMGTFHARTLAGLPGVEVVAVADPHEPNRSAVADELGCEAIADPFELARADVDGVVIASPDETHPDLALAAMEQDTFVLCEKPLATTLADAQRVVDAEVALDRRLVQLGFMREYDPAHVQLVEAMHSIGPVDHLRAVHRNTHPSLRPIEQIIGQSVVHDIHSVRFLTGAEIVDVTAFGSGAAHGSFRHVVAMCRLDSGAHATLEFDEQGFAYEVAVEVLGRGGDALTGVPTRAVTRRDGSIDVHVGTDWFAWFAEAYRVQDAAWVRSIAAGEAVGPTTWDGYVAHAVVEAILASLASRATVRVETADRPALY